MNIEHDIEQVTKELKRLIIVLNGTLTPQNYREHSDNMNKFDQAWNTLQDLKDQLETMKESN